MPPRLVRHQRPNVVIAGGGVAGLEALLALHALAGHVAEITLLSSEREFLYRPLTVAEPFGRGQARSYDITRLVVDTPGHRPLELVGTAASEKVEDLLSSRGIELQCNSLATQVTAGALMLSGGERVEADRVVTLPLSEGRRIGGLPHDQNGFIPVDGHG